MWTPTHVQITVHRARNIVCKTKGGSDAFATIQLGDEKFRTSVKTKTSNPEWHEECDLQIPNDKSHVVISVYHRSFVGLDDFLGQVTISLDELAVYDAPKSSWYALSSKPGKKEKHKYRGEIEVKVGFIVLSKTTSLLDVSKKKKKSASDSIKAMAQAVGDKLSVKNHPSRTMSISRLDIIGQSRSKKSLSSSPQPVRASFNISPNDTPTHGMYQSGSLSDLSHENSSTPNTPTRELIKVPVLHNKGKCSSLDGKDTPKKSQKNRYSWAPESNSGSEWSLKFGTGNPSEELSKSVTNIHKDSPTDFLNKTVVPVIHVQDPDGSDQTFNNTFSQETRGANKAILAYSKRHTLHGSCVPKEVKADLKEGRYDRVQEFLDQQRAKERKDDTVPAHIIDMYKHMTREDLIKTVWSQKEQLVKKDQYIKDMENYIDTMLLRIMDTAPKLLQVPYNVKNIKEKKKK
ncbi:rab11 family-interacting protein 2 [Lingula anatina]|uniref:Rab11 family-interacting protein 2 n=1 Tax=Lingula anatina TaxID=7574 RepID=A0A1S3JIC8_LINAN|nr:rab11 family-interacting protein 2 [Lingula anatina]|eukprot:XP_013409654.1 rab11 family-interacting protein 2 [Lingula anatina]